MFLDPYIYISLFLSPITSVQCVYHPHILVHDILKLITCYVLVHYLHSSVTSLLFLFFWISLFSFNFYTFPLFFRICKFYFLEVAEDHDKLKHPIYSSSVILIMCSVKRKIRELYQYSCDRQFKQSHSNSSFLE